MKRNIIAAVVTTVLLPLTAFAANNHTDAQASDKDIAQQRTMLEKNTQG